MASCNPHIPDTPAHSTGFVLDKYVDTAWWKSLEYSKMRKQSVTQFSLQLTSGIAELPHALGYVALYRY